MLNQPPEQPAEPKPELNPKKWNQKLVMGEDKWEHGIAGVVIGIGGFFMAETVLEGFGFSKKGALLLAILFSIAAVGGAMYGKECWDSMGHGQADVWDALCGFTAFLCVALPIIIAYAYISISGSSKEGKE